MTTYNQFLNSTRLKKKYHKWKRRALAKSPQKIAKCATVTKISPKKPCSAKRSIALVKLRSGIRVYCYIPGIGHNLRPREQVFICGGRRNDLPGVKYKIIRGPKFPLSMLGQLLGRPPRISSRSVYGLPKLISEDEKKDRLERLRIRANKKHFQYKIFRREPRLKIAIQLKKKLFYLRYSNKQVVYLAKFQWYRCL